MTQVQLAARAGVDQAAISKLENGQLQRSTAVASLAACLKVSPLWLETGVGLAEPGNDSSAIPFQEPRYRVPLLGYGDVLAMLKDTGAALSGALEYVETSVPVMGATFAMRVSGESMEPLFSDGMTVVVEPSMTPLAGDYVIAAIGDDVTLKQLVRDAGQDYLKPLNPRYPMRSLEGARIIGVVRAAERKFR